MPPHKPLAEQIGRKIAKAGIDDCWLWNGARTRQGYGCLTHLGKPMLAHRAAYKCAFGTDPVGFIVMHKCDNPPCCNPRHLVLGTVGENNRDRHEKRRSKGGASPGETNPSAILNSEAVKEIYQSSETHSALARKYGVVQQSIYDIRVGRNWRHVTAGLTCGYKFRRTESATVRAGQNFR